MNVEKFLRDYNSAETMITDDMFIYDENSEDLGVSKEKLMENAGSNVSKTVIESVDNLEKRNIHVFCGLGNNGGDGFVVARHLAAKASNINVYLLGDNSKIRTPEALNNWKILTTDNVSINYSEITDSSTINMIKDAIDENSIFIDALLGSGIKGKIREPIASTIMAINEMKEKHAIPVFSIDVPSGMDPNTGGIANVHINATSTVTFHKMKEGLLNKSEITGGVTVAPIGIPPEAEWLVGKGDVKLLLKKKREPSSTKGMNGKIVIIGGSQYYSGAPTLAALSALRCGIDLVNVCAPTSVSSTIRSFSPDLIVTPLEGNVICEKNLDELQLRIKWADTILVGPGIGTMEDTFRTVNKLYEFALKEKKKLVIDADGLKAVVGNLSIIDDTNVIITPHAGEFSIISGAAIENLNYLKDKLKVAGEFAKKCKCNTIIKGPTDIVINSIRCKLNYSGTPAMTVGGTGDVLAGITAALASLYGINGDRMFKAACAAVHVNGLTGELTEQQNGGPFITASSMIGNIPAVLSRFL
ncbi:MAG: NAD(P)H-hydrate dehydratase [Candidatus Hodarchaeota archaeon]